MSPRRSGARRSGGANFSGPKFSAMPLSAPGRSDLAAMMRSCTGANRLRRTPPGERLPHGNGAGVGRGRVRGCGYQSSLKPAVMLLFSVGWPASVTDVVTRSGPNSFCSALSVWCVTGSLLALVQPAPNVVPVGSTLNFTDLELSNTWAGPGAAAAGGAAAASVETVGAAAIAGLKISVIE